MDRQVRYEKSYGKYRNLPQPTIVKINVRVEFYPNERRATLDGVYTLTNEQSAPIEEVHVWLTPLAEATEIRIESAAEIAEDEILGYHIYRLAEPLEPGRSTQMAFSVELAEHGFTYNGQSRIRRNRIYLSSLNYNGSLLTRVESLPYVGYLDMLELQNPAERLRRGLVQHHAPPSAEDNSARWRNTQAPDAGWIQLDALVGTAGYQIALAPGELVAESTRNDRRYFHYQSTRPLAPALGFASARWQVREHRENGTSIQVYYHDDHRRNVDQFLTAARRSVAYFADNFSTYTPGQSFRIVEVPPYGDTIDVLDGMMIFPEDHGFTTDVGGETDHVVEDIVFPVALSMARQWWGIRVLAADVEGAPVLTEALSVYCALMTVNAEYGTAVTRKLLQRLLSGYRYKLPGSSDAKRPLIRTSDQRDGFNRGGLALFQIQSIVGEAKLNQALANFLRGWAFRGPPYATSLDLADYIRAEVPYQDKQAVDNILNSVTLDYGPEGSSGVE